jgi:hypothetical protein
VESKARDKTSELCDDIKASTEPDFPHKEWNEVKAVTNGGQSGNDVAMKVSFH